MKKTSFATERIILLAAAVLTFIFIACASRSVPQSTPVTPTQVPPPPPAPQPTPAPQPEPLETIQFTIQVGAFAKANRAADFAELMQAAGMDAYHFIDDDGLFKVRFERFDTESAALQRAAQLQEEGLIKDFYIVQPRSDGQHVTFDSRLELQKRLVKTARRFIGTPYRWGGTSQSNGFDCSGLTMTVYRLNGMDLPRNAYGQFHAGTRISRKNLQAGDLVFFATGKTDRISHVGIYSGEDKFIHAPGRGKRIRTASLSNSYFSKRYKGARRYY